MKGEGKNHLLFVFQWNCNEILKVMIYIQSINICPSILLMLLWPICFDEIFLWCD